jgi:acetoin utilization deacetylase AcuC-like enzyme
LNHLLFKIIYGTGPPACDHSIVLLKKAHMARKTGIVKDYRYTRHMSGFGHPESPARLESIYQMLGNPDIYWKYQEIEPRMAEREEIAYVHTLPYIERIAATTGKSCVLLDEDTTASEESYDIARLAAGGLMNAIDAVMTREVDNAFAFVRPPGHHAGEGNSAGFCIFNNVAIGALHAIQKHQLQNILIVDWDLHHGNGTQKTFYSDRRVLYFSTHQYPYYPGTGSLREIGTGQALGYTVNVPLSPGAGNGTFVSAFRNILAPIAQAFKPELILVSAGFDIHHQDPLGGMRVTPEGFAALARVLLNIADHCCAGRFVAVLEGGYHVAALTRSVKTTLEEMSDDTHCKDDRLDDLEQEVDEKNKPIIKSVISGIQPYWDVF